ncbi:helix-turn-helix domain-containing protein [Nocardia sp. NPDC049220]|uniref:helix-turn-helix transcriptional regulator n=1 Tax=Nocardia sp. NPDC049220 TaxID=3155273 RepID=UPI0033CF76D1
MGDDLPGKKWLTREEAGEYLGVHHRTLANWAAKGHGPRYSKPSGKSCMYRLADLDAYLEAHLAQVVLTGIMGVAVRHGALTARQHVKRHRILVECGITGVLVPKRTS